MFYHFYVGSGNHTQELYSVSPDWFEYCFIYHTKESENWPNQTSTSNRYTALLEEESEDQQQKADPENTPKPPPIYITC
jgi:hypothetical protein